MSGAVFLIIGAGLGAAAGWLAGRAYGARAGRGGLRAYRDSSDRITASAIRAVDAAADLPPGAKLDVMCRVLANRAAERTGLPSMVILRDVEGGPITVTVVSDGYDARLIGLPVEPDSWAGRAVTDGIPVVAPEHEPVVWVGVGDRRRPIKGGVAVPIRSSSRIEGAVLVLGRPLLEPSEVITRLEALVIRVAPLLGPAHDVAIAERKANTDELTGLANRRFLSAAMSLGDPSRSALVMLDLDHFKVVNDTLGHPAGDTALKHLAKLLKTALRGGDVAARIGGEEFAVWLPGADLALAMEVAERLRALVAERAFRIGGTEYPITISCGVSACPVPIPEPANLMATADAALYRAKREGRNRVVATTGKDG
ncbi:MAG TPA: GGDEF domain-containing protein [Gemmatimonadales bacterium]|nr:GGDEF domain-containing protein [Gemmatimonadales bacterium]